MRGRIRDTIAFNRSRWATTVGAEIITELICFEPKVCICNGNYLEYLEISVCNERFSAYIPAKISVSVMKFIFLATQFCICNSNKPPSKEMSLCDHFGWAMFRKPQPLLVSEKVRQYTSNLYGSTPPICIAVLSWLLSFEERETLQYASHLYCSTPPICTAVRPPFVRQYFWKNTGGWGHRNAHRNPNFARTLCLECVLMFRPWWPGTSPEFPDCP